MTCHVVPQPMQCCAVQSSFTETDACGYVVATSGPTVPLALLFGFSKDILSMWASFDGAKIVWLQRPSC